MALFDNRWPLSTKKRRVEMIGNKTGTFDLLRRKILIDLTNIAEFKIKDFVINKIKDAF